MQWTRWVCLTMIAVSVTGFAGENWPNWRGPSYTGATDAKNLPAAWSETQNIVWKTPMPGWSGATPVVWGKRIFVMSPSKDANADPSKRGLDAGPGGPDVLLMCLSADDGKVLWQTVVDTGNVFQREQNMASPSPVTDGKHVWIQTGTGVVAALDMDGKMLWKKNLQTDYGKFGQMFGYASSPVLLDGKLIVQVLHGWTTDDPSYLVAYDPIKGDVIWRHERPTDALEESPDAYNTPVVLPWEGKNLLVCLGGDCVTAHDPATGEEIWRALGTNPKKLAHNRTIASAVAANGIVLAPTRVRPLIAVRAGGKGDVTATHVAWKYDLPQGPDVPTPACDDKYAYLVGDMGAVACVELATGKVLWGPEKVLHQDVVRSSPLLADGKVYVSNRKGETAVLAAGPEFKLLGVNQLDGAYVLSSIAAVDGKLFVRTDTNLYCIAEKK